MKTTTRKLTLHRETIATLQDRQLDDIHGGIAIGTCFCGPRPGLSGTPQQCVVATRAIAASARQAGNAARRVWNKVF